MNTLDYYVTSERDIIEIISKYLIRITLVCTMIEALFFSNLENIYGCITLLFGCVLNAKFIFTRDNLTKFPLPTVALFGYIFCYFFLPLPVTLLEFKPLTFNFEFPYLTFTNQIYNIIMFVSAFLVCKHIYRPDNILSALWRKIGYFETPTARQVWTMGFMGLIALAYYAITQGNDDDANIEATSGLLDQLMNYLKPMSYYPLCLLFPFLYGSSKSTPKTPVYLFLVALMGLGVMSTRRNLVFSAIMLIALVSLFVALKNNKRIMSPKNAILSVVLLLLVTGPMTDLATAMILNRHSINGSATFSQIMELYQDKEKLHNLQQLAAVATDNGGDNSQGWSEYYVDNIFLDRFCNLRVQDATLSYAKSLGYESSIMTGYRDQFFINQLPSTITNSLGLKKEMIYTATDLMVSTRMGIDYLNYGWRVGGDTGIGLSIWGYWYYLVAFFTYVALFYVFSTLTITDRNIYLIPLPVIAGLSGYFLYFLNGYGIFKGLTFLLRNGFQEIIVYCVIYFVVRKIIK